jgi:hypothetical protein
MSGWTKLAASLTKASGVEFNRVILARKAKGWIGNEAGTAIDALSEADEGSTMSAVKHSMCSSQQSGAAQ